jgi:hypothetical protein
VGILQIIGLQGDVLFEHLGVNVYVRLTQAYRSLSRSSSVPKPRYPPNSVGVLASTQGKVQITCTKVCVFRDDKNSISKLSKFRQLKLTN